MILCMAYIVNMSYTCDCTSIYILLATLCLTILLSGRSLLTGQGLNKTSFTQKYLGCFPLMVLSLDVIGSYNILASYTRLAVTMVHKSYIICDSEPIIYL